VRGVAQQPKLFVAMILILIFAEVLGMCSLSRAPQGISEMKRGEKAMMGGLDDWTVEWE